MKTARVLLTLGLSLTAFAAVAQTPPMSYKLAPMNFDMWCQETRHYPPARCDQRLPDDDAEFKAYRQTVESYELKHLELQRQEQERDRSLLRHDPIDNPTRAGSAPPGSAGTIPDPH